jgi:hypothetical protein
MTKRSGVQFGQRSGIETGLSCGSGSIVAGERMRPRVRKAVFRWAVGTVPATRVRNVPVDDKPGTPSGGALSRDRAFIFVGAASRRSVFDQSMADATWKIKAASGLVVFSVGAGPVACPERERGVGGAPTNLHLVGMQSSSPMTVQARKPAQRCWRPTIAWAAT